MNGPGMLAGLRVVDCTDESGALAGKILADLGADVVVVEPPGGDPERRRGPFLGGAADPERSLAWLALQTSKRGVSLDRESASGRARFLRLVDAADVLIETRAQAWLAARGLDYPDLAARSPRLVHCTITPFGRTGPYAHYRGRDLVAVSMGGNLAVTGEPDRPPVRCSFPTAYYHAGPEAVIGILGALYERETSGRGQQVDVSLQETQLQTLLSAPGQFALDRTPRRRTGARLGRTLEIWRARDGMVSYGLRGGAARVGSLRALVGWLHEHGMASEWLRQYDWDSYSHLEVKPDDLARIESELGAFFATRTMRELYEGALARRILLAPCNDAREIAEHPQLRSRDLFRRVEYPHLGVSLEHVDFFGKVSPHPMGVRRAPRVGEHDAEVDAEWAAREAGSAAPPAGAPAAPAASGAAAGRGVFAGLRVLELGAGAAGPVATKVFAEHGARVVRIESARRPDFLRTLFLTKESRFGMDGSPMFVLLNPNKESLALNLKQPRARALLERLVQWADVVCENFAPGVMERMGFGPARLRELNPRLILAQGCLFGQTGPQREYPGFGGQGSAIAGMNHLTGWPDGPAHGPYGTITDSLSPRYVASAIAAALWRRARTGEGAHIDLSQIESAIYSLSEVQLRHAASGEVPGRRGNRDERAAPHGVYPCRGDDRWIAIAVWSDADWALLVRAMGDPAWARDLRYATSAGRLAHQDELDAELAAWTRGFEPHALMRTLQAAGVEAGAVQTFADLLEDPQLAHRHHFVPIRHVHLGELPFERAGFRLSGGSGALSLPGPNLGEHTRALLGELLGLSDAETLNLVAEEVAV